MAVDGQPSSFPPKPPDSRMSYASAASGSISFNLKKPLIPLSSYRGEPAIVVPEDVIKESLVDFNFALVGKFPIYPKIIRPNMERIRLFFARLNLKAAYSIGSLDLGHILIRLNSAEDYQRIWARETWDIGKVQMKIFKWSMDFASHKESSIIPAWILLPGLPPNFFQQHILFSIVQVVGNPLKMDQATATLSRPSIARICVELDLLTPNPSRIWISSGNKDKGFWQKIDYEYLPLYCCDCFRLGHSQAACPGSMMPSPNLQHNYRESPQHRQPLRGQESNSKDVSNNIVKFSSHGLQVSRSAINASDADVSTAPTNVAPQSVYVPQIWVPRVKKMMSHNQNNENAGNSSIVVSNAFASLQELEEESAPANIDHLISGNLLQHGTNASAVDLQQDNSADLEQGAESTNIISPHSQQGVDLQQSDNQLTQPILHRSCCLDQSPFQQSSEIVAENLMPVHTHHLSLVDLNTNTEMSGEKTNKQVKLGRINTYTSEEKTNTEMSGGTLNNVSLCTQNANTHVQACPNLQGILKLINSSAADPIPEDGDVEDVEDNSEEIAINREKNTKDNSAGVEEMSINAEKYTEDSPVHVNGKEIIPWTGINCDEIDLTHNSSGLNARARGFLIPKTRSTFKIGRKPVRGQPI